MAKIYDYKNPTMKWCLQREFKETGLTFVSGEHSEAVFYNQTDLYYSFMKEIYSDRARRERIAAEIGVDNIEEVKSSCDPTLGRDDQTLDIARVNHEECS